MQDHLSPIMKPMKMAAILMLSRYNARNSNTADKMIDYLNDPDYGSHIKTVYVTFSKSEEIPVSGMRSKTLS